MKINYKNVLSLLGCISGMACMSPTAQAQSLALNLSATGNNISIPSYTMDLTSGNAVTIQLDVKLHNLSQLQGMVFMSNGNTAAPLVSYYWNGDNKFHIERGDGTTTNNSLSPNGLFVANQWYNLAMVLKEDTVFTYLDGILISTDISGTSSYNASFTDNLFIGDRENGGVNADAEFDNIRIWTAEKTQAEIDSLRNTCIDGSDPDLSVLYTFEEGSGTTVYDLAMADGSQDATIAGTATWTTGTLGSTRSTIFPTACDNYSSPSGNYSWSTSGQYMDTVVNSHNCDSIITVNLQIFPAMTEQQFAVNSYTFCDSGTVSPSLTSSQAGINYYLLDNTSATIQGPVTGTGSAIAFNAFTENQTTSFHLKGQKTYADTAGYSYGNSYAQTAAMTLSQDFTFEAWIKNTITNTAWTGIVATSSTVPGTGGYAQLVFNGSGKLRTEVNGGAGYTLDGSAVVEDGNWHFVALTNDKDSIKLYVDGQLDASMKRPSSELFSMSRVINIADQRYEGGAGEVVIDNLGIFDTTLTAAQIKANMNRYFTGNESHLMAFYNFENNIGITGFTDLTGNFDATITGITSFDRVDGLRGISYCETQMIDSIAVTINTVDATATNASPTLTANATGATYQWIDCNNGNAPITGATSQSYTATADGNYAVVVTQNGCSDTSACMSVGNLGIANNALANYSIYPNPSNGTFTISLGKNYSQANVHVLDVLGKTVLSATLNHQTNTIDMSKSPKGVYFVQLNSEAGVSQIAKIVVE